MLQERDVAIRVENVFQDGIRAGRVVGQFHEFRDPHRNGVGNVICGYVGRSRRTIDLIIECGGARLAEEGGVRRIREGDELGERGVDAHATDIIAAPEREAGRVVAAELEVLQAARSAEAGSGPEAIDKGVGRNKTGGIIEERGRRNDAVFQEIFVRRKDLPDGVGEAAARGGE